MHKYGLIGYPLSHTFSPGYFAKKFQDEEINNAEYKAYPLENIQEVKELIESGIAGFNVTIPYKEQVIPFLDEIDGEALSIGAVNTVKIYDGIVKGYNTDVYGFQESLLELLDGMMPDRALVLGSGGAAKAVWYALNKMNVRYTVISRKIGYMHYNQIDSSIIKNHQLIINTTPLGMAPRSHTFPLLPYHAVSEKHFFYDLVYNPEKTLFLTKAAACGAKVKNGLDMLHLQAEKSWQIWTQP